LAHNESPAKIEFIHDNFAKHDKKLYQCPMNNVLHYSQYTLRPCDTFDLGFLLAVRTDPAVSQWLGSYLPLETTLAQQEAWFEKIRHNPSIQYLIFEDDGQPLGYARLSEIDPHNASACIGADIAPQHQGKGHGRALYRLLLEKCFEEMGLNRVWLYVLEHNARAIHLYEKLGFHHEGAQRQAIRRDGRFYDYRLMGLLRGEYLAMQAAIKKERNGA
jgi:UDP-4-amino-4,6-dideoxy-N-acetyl-beta-L-altrosamine N-acetyltransferase